MIFVASHRPGHAKGARHRHLAAGGRDLVILVLQLRANDVLRNTRVPLTLGLHRSQQVSRGQLLH